MPFDLELQSLYYTQLEDFVILKACRSLVNTKARTPESRQKIVYLTQGIFQAICEAIEIQTGIRVTAAA